MKKIILLFFILNVTLLGRAQVSKTINVSIAGTLSSSLTVNELTSVTDLTITVIIDARDFKTMRDNMPLLSDLDVSEVSIGAYTGTEGTLSSVNVRYPENNIPTNAFYSPSAGLSKTSLKIISLPSSVTSIGYSAFKGCVGLNNSLVIPTSVTTLGDHAFSGCIGIKSISLTANISALQAYTFENFSSMGGELNIPSTVTSIGDAAFWSCSGLTSVVIPSSVATIGSGSFYGCTGLTSATLPSTITSIGNYAFQGCTGLSGALVIPPTVISIGNYSYQGCNKLTSLSIPSSITSIGNSAFTGCTALTSIYAYKNTPISLNSSTLVFSSINKSTCTLYVPKGSIALYQAANQWKDFTNMVELLTAAPAILNGIISLYPNLVTDGFHIVGLEGKAKLSLVDINGKELLAKQVNNNEFIHINNFPKDVYIINIISSEGTLESKLIKK